MELALPFQKLGYGLTLDLYEILLGSRGDAAFNN
jgi:hypothetical protein